jgi:hypothetical protein
METYNGASLPEHLVQKLFYYYWNELGSNKRGKPILQINPSGKIIDVFPRIVDAEASTGINKSSISCAARGKIQNAGGFYWKFVEDTFKNTPKNEREFFDPSIFPF